MTPQNSFKKLNLIIEYYYVDKKNLIKKNLFIKNVIKKCMLIKKSFDE